ncbi:MAG: hypothetical protein WBF69_04945 [Castellaniella sp.]|uniref:hypothetical protein n=1 Tax=Castellaniella sp. TaxID=1955812 RepID=UPI003C792C88
MMLAGRLIWVERTPLVFGLEWMPVLGEPELAGAQARREGASHQALSGNPPAALGLVRGLKSRQPCWAAADLWARQHPQGAVACVVPLGPDAWHVLASHEGVVLARADRSYPDADLADQAVEALRLAYPRLQVRPCDADGNEVLQALARQAASAPPLVRVRRRGGWLALLALVVLAGAGWWGWGVAAEKASALEQASDSRLLWERALAHVLAQRPVHGEQGTRTLLQALYEQPVQVAGWVLQQVHCQPGAGGWQCRSEYRRLAAQADNRGLLRAAPTAWRLDFPTLDRAQAAWTLPLAGQPADPARLPASRLVARDWASALQAVLPAFTALRMDAPQAVQVPPPRDEQGRAVAPPPDLPRLASRLLKVEGPLRSGELLAPLSQSVSWHKVSLSHAPGARPGLKASRLVLHLEGSLYENQE